MTLEDLKPGDCVAHHYSRGNPAEKLTVDRITKTQIIAGGKRFMRNNGYKIGKVDKWSYHAWITPWTEQHTSELLEYQEKIEKRNLISAIRNGDFMALPVEKKAFIGGKGRKIMNTNFTCFTGGTFKLGETGKTVEVKPFEMAVYPVINKEYEEFDPSHRELRNQYSDQDNQPVANVSWHDAVRYCKWLSEKTGETYRLPTEAEWEFAASGGGQRKYPWGDDEPSPQHANYYKSKINKTTPVGSYPLGRTPEGLFDMAGNVWEWCDDWYDEKQEYRVVRGGSFISTYRDNRRCALRGRGDPHLRNDYMGFRVVRVRGV